MRLLKLFLILTFLPLLATEETEKCIDAPAKKQVEHHTEMSQKDSLKPDEKPLEMTAPTQKTPDVHQTTESYETAFIKTIVVLVGLLVLVILTVWMFKKISSGRLRSFNSLKSVKILEKRPLSPKSMLYLIEVGGKQVLVAESQLEVRPVTTLDWLGDDKDL